MLMLPTGGSNLFLSLVEEAMIPGKCGFNVALPKALAKSPNTPLNSLGYAVNIFGFHCGDE